MQSPTSETSATAILVVDDDEAIQALMRVLLERKGYRVDEARDGQDALHKIRNGNYAVILLDLMMPRVNGFEMIREMKALQPSWLKRTIVFTAASESTLKDFDDSQVFRLIRKPFDIRTLTAVIADCARSNGASTGKRDSRAAARGSETSAPATREL